MKSMDSSVSLTTAVVTALGPCFLQTRPVRTSNGFLPDTGVYFLRVPIIPSPLTFSQHSWSLWSASLHSFLFWTEKTFLCGGHELGFCYHGF